MTLPRDTFPNADFKMPPPIVFAPENKLKSQDNGPSAPLKNPKSLLKIPSPFSSLEPNNLSPKPLNINFRAVKLELIPVSFPMDFIKESIF